MADTEILITGKMTIVDLADQIVWADIDVEDVMDLITEIDMKVADAEFTHRLIHKLNATLEEDDRVTVAVGSQELNKAMQGVLDSLAKFMELINRGTDTSDV